MSTDLIFEFLSGYKENRIHKLVLAICSFFSAQIRTVIRLTCTCGGDSQDIRSEGSLWSTSIIFCVTEEPSPQKAHLHTRKEAETTDVRDPAQAQVNKTARTEKEANP